MGMIILNDIDGKEKQIEILKEALKGSKNIRLHKRCSVVLLHYEGFTNKKIAEMEGLGPHAVGDYIRNFKKNGLNGLDMKYSPGAPRKLNKEREARLVDVITNNTPEDVGFQSKKNWTLKIIRQWVYNEFNIKMSQGGMCELLHKLNLSYTRPTYVLAKADKAKQEIFKKDFEGLKKTSLWGS